jgi:hypothetical protein
VTAAAAAVVDRILARPLPVESRRAVIELAVGLACSEGLGEYPWDDLGAMLRQPGPGPTGITRLALRCVSVVAGERDAQAVRAQPAEALRLLEGVRQTAAGEGWRFRYEFLAEIGGMTPGWVRRQLGLSDRDDRARVTDWLNEDSMAEDFLYVEWVATPGEVVEAVRRSFHGDWVEASWPQAAVGVWRSRDTPGSAIPLRGTIVRRLDAYPYVATLRPASGDEGVGAWRTRVIRQLAGRGVT